MRAQFTNSEKPGKYSSSAGDLSQTNNVPSFKFSSSCTKHVNRSSSSPLRITFVLSSTAAAPVEPSNHSYCQNSKVPAWIPIFVIVSTGLYGRPSQASPCIRLGLSWGKTSVYRAKCFSHPNSCLEVGRHDSRMFARCDSRRKHIQEVNFLLSMKESDGGSS